VDPARDMGAVADLIQAAFADDLDQAGYSMLREMRNVGRLGALLWWFDGAGSGLNQMLTGFVWVEDGQVVGNVTLTQTPYVSDRWIISNVAVARPYRGRGIARSLMSAALDLVREWRGKVVTLQVRDDNLSALHIYQTMGFAALFGTTYLRLDQVTPVSPLPPTGVQLRPLPPADGDMAYQVGCAATPRDVQAEQPLRVADYQLGLDKRLSDWLRKLAGRATPLRLVAECGDRLQAIIVAEPTGRGSESQIKLTVHPQERGSIEREMISHALHYLYQWTPHAVVARHPTYHPEGVEGFRSFGFQIERTLLWMKREM